MLRFSALIPDATVNYVKNPSMRYDTTDWNASGATLTRVLTQARFGIASLQVVTAGTGLRQGAYYRVSALTGVSEPITVSAYVRGTGRVRIRLINNPFGSEWFSETIQLETDRWQRIWATGFSTGSNDLDLYVETDESVATARTFFVDGAQLERKAYPTTYCDGDQPGCRWNGLYHASTSQRDQYTRAGGRWVQLGGPEREAEDLYMTVVTGLGHAPITNNVQTFALEPGAYFQNKKVNIRPIVVQFHAKHVVNDSDEPVSLAALHQLRQMLLDVVKPDLTGGDEEIWFEYFDGTKPLYFKARYDGGMEGEWDVRNQFVNSFPLRLIATSPLIEEDSQDVATLDFQETLSSKNILVRKDGRWDYVNGGLNQGIAEMGLGPRGEIYAVGTFTVVNVPAYTGAPTVDPNRPANGIAYFDGEKWIPLNTASLGVGTIDSIDIAPNGFVYVAGTFTSIGGVAANRVAYWNGSAWNAMGTGLNAGASVVRVAPNGTDVYVGGSFSDAGGVVCVRIARWDGLQWRRVGQFGGLNGVVRDIDFSMDGSTVYVGGDFTDQNGLAANALLRVTQYNTTTGLFSAMGNGFNDSVTDVYAVPNGNVFAGGAFTLSGSATMLRTAEWNGSAWVALGSGLNSSVNYIARYKDNLAFVGIFTQSGVLPMPGVGIWNDSAFFNLDIFPTLNIETAMSNPLTEDFYLGVGAENVEVGGLTLVTNPGSMEALPTIYVKGGIFLKWIENQTTGKTIYLNMVLLDDEEVFFDFAGGRVYSTLRGSLMHMVLAGSDFHGFTLAPGENKIVCFATNDVDAVMQMVVKPIHWSMDATQEGEGL